MGYVVDGVNSRRVFDPERNSELTYYVRDVPRGEHHYTFLIHEIRFPVETIFSISEINKNFIVEAARHEIEARFRGHAPPHLKHDEGRRLFREAVLPALREAIICLESRILRADDIRQGWKVAVNFTESSRGDAPSAFLN